ncbi:MAG: efflux RND transporter periplasmic adaptor subunit, partial [Ottowia sp.]|nr:efflux RND transporter periplasmic adaptor subunit [Ottowia sp.]
MTDAAPCAVLSPPRRQKGGAGAWLLVLLVLAVGGWFWWHKPAQTGAGSAGARPDEALPVGVAPVVARTVPLEVRALGTVTAAQTVTVQARLDGRLEALGFEEGQPVKRGQMLAQLDARAAQAAVEQMRGQVRRDEALLENARRDLKRYRQLQEVDSISAQQVDTQAAKVREYEGAVQAGRAQLKEAEVLLSHTRITSPIDGVAGLRQVDVGNMVRSSDANGIVVVTQLQPIDVRFSLPEADLPQLQRARAQGVPAVTVWDRDERTLLATGTLAAVDNRINAETGTLALKARFDNADGALFPNQFVNVRLALGERPHAVLVPSAAVVPGRGGNFVYVVTDEGTAVRTQDVVTDGEAGEFTLIREGVQAGQEVVVDGLDRLRDG